MLNEMKVTAKKGTGFYIRAAKSFFSGVAAKKAADGKAAIEAKAPVEELKIFGLGAAINVATAVAAKLEADSIADVMHVETGYPEMHGSRGCAQIVISMKKVAKAAEIADPVLIDYNDLVNGVDLTSKIHCAYGYEGLGILVVTNIPGFAELRQALLPLSRKFGNLPPEVRAKYEDEGSFYSVGWSLGKEKLQGRPDFAKGSYYANPLHDVPETDEEIVKKYPPYFRPNIWPEKEIPEFAGAFMALGRKIVEVGKFVANQCDSYVSSRVKNYPPQKLYNVIESSRCCKARLLHYYPIAESGSNFQEEKKDDFSDWCGWHNDHGSLTGLVSAMFMNDEGKEIPNEDPAAGLYIRSRSSVLYKVKIPKNALAFQIGETAQIHSGGVLQATPHAVKGTSIPRVSRNTFAVFMQPEVYERMNIPEGKTEEDAQSQLAAQNLPAGVPRLGSRWDPAMDFNEFSEKTLTSYY